MIDVRNLTKFYAAFQALNNVSFQVGKGEILGLLGPNGAGKSTTMRIITCYLPPTSGLVTIKGLDIREKPVEAKRLVGYLPEFAPFYPDMLVLDYLKYVAAIRDLPRKQREQRIEEMVELCGLFGMMHRPFRELSRGYKQRVGIAHALMSDPEVLILDEPTSGLDPNQIVEIRSIIKEIGKKKTIIFSTHILAEAEATCDRIVIIDKGHIVADGTTASITSSRKEQYRFQLSLTDANFAEAKSVLGEIEGVEEIVQVAGDAEDEIRIQLRCSRDNRREISGRMNKRNWSVVEFVRERDSLENTFRELTGSDVKESRKKK